MDYPLDCCETPVWEFGHDWRFLAHDDQEPEAGYWYCTKCRAVVFERMRIEQIGNPLGAVGVPSDS